MAEREWVLGITDRLVDASGKIIGEVRKLWADDCWKASVGEKVVGFYVDERRAQLAVEAALDAPPPSAMVEVPL